MRILVTGAGGQLGQDVARAGQARDLEVLACSRADLDVADSEAVERVLGDVRPQAVIHCAAWTDVDGAEADPDGAMRLNGEAAGHVAGSAARSGALTVHVSTDYVFDGGDAGGYVESAPTAPRSAYGRSKLAGEHAVARAAPDRHAIVRTAWLFGTGGHNFVETMLRLGLELGEVGVVTDQVGCPTFTGHLAPALLDVAERGLRGIHHAAATGHCSWHGFAEEIFRQAAVPCTVRQRTTADLDRPAPRPASSVLRSERTDTPRLPPWQDGLAAYLAQRAALAAERTPA